MTFNKEQESEKEVEQKWDNHIDEEVDLIEIFRKVIAIRKKLYKAAVIGLMIGVVVGVSIPKKYTVSVTLSPEMGSNNEGKGLSSLAATFLGGSNGMGNATDALNASLSSDIVSSTPFLLELLHMPVSVDNGEVSTLSAYLETESSPWWSCIIGLPSGVVGGIKALFTEDKEPASGNRNDGVVVITEEEKKQIDELSKRIMASMDKKTAITRVSVTLQHPEVAAVVADAVVDRLQEHIISYRTSKSKEDCAYLEKLFEERKQEYYATQKEYAEYVDSHDNLILHSVRTEQERLQNDMNLAYQVYSQVANQLQVARAKMQEEKPVFAVVEPAVVPLKASGVGKAFYGLFFMFVSVFSVLAWILLGKNIIAIFDK